MSNIDGNDCTTSLKLAKDYIVLDRLIKIVFPTYSYQLAKSIHSKEDYLLFHVNNFYHIWVWDGMGRDMSGFFKLRRGWSGGAMVLGKLPVPGRPTILITVRQGPIALAAGAGGGGLDTFTLIYPSSSFSLSLGDGPI